VTPVEAPEPFEAPPLAELDKEVGWIDRPVRDGLCCCERRRPVKVCW